MIEMRPYEAELAAVVFRGLDAYDRIEAELVRGGPQHYLALFGDWHAIARQHLVSVVLARDLPSGLRPFAVAGLASTGVAGVAEAALLAADHRRHKWDIGRAVVQLYPRLRQACVDAGVHRIEARSWSGHPTARHLLRHLGFKHECDLPRYGGHGAHTFQLHALTL